MDFFKKIFGSTSSAAPQDHFVVDENGIAQDSGSVKAPVLTSSENISTSEQKISTTPAQQKKDIDESVADTSAFDELMQQAENSVDSRVPDQPILDPEFQKAKDEIQSEEGIEIFPAE